MQGINKILCKTGLKPIQKFIPQCTIFDDIHFELFEVRLGTFVVYTNSLIIYRLFLMTSIQIDSYLN